ncbi:MAG: polymerase primary sigma factor [Gaiellales bacterium]|nr:polymerase primary sigma factor [Gaiellales bacterium]
MPLMDEDARIQRLAAAAATGDRDARARCVELAYPRFRGLARRYEGRGVSRDDLAQDVALGIMRAIERYDPSRGTPFLAWAHTWVRQALQQALAEQSRPYRLTRHALWDLHEAKTAQEQLWQTDRSEPSLTRLADHLGWPGERVAHVLRSGQTPEHPDAIDLVEDPLSSQTYDDVIARVTATQIRPLLLALPERERDILERRANDETLRTVARALGLSHQRVATLEERAIAKLNASADTTTAPQRG